MTSVKVEDHPLERIYDVLEVGTLGVNKKWFLNVFSQVSPGRIIRILTSVFPKYFAIISRVREDVRSVGQEGGKVRKSTVVSLIEENPLQVVLDIEPRLRATFPKNAVKKKIKVWILQNWGWTLNVYSGISPTGRPTSHPAMQIPIGHQFQSTSSNCKIAFTNFSNLVKCFSSLEI